MPPERLPLPRARSWASCSAVRTTRYFFLVMPGLRPAPGRLPPRVGLEVGLGLFFMTWVYHRIKRA